MNNKKTILIDFDGVLNNYNGYYSDILPTIKVGAKSFLRQLHNEFKVVIFSTRGQQQIHKWLTNHNLLKYIDGITDKKLPAYLIIDDRCITFKGDYNDTLNQIAKFKVWYK